MKNLYLFVLCILLPLCAWSQRSSIAYQDLADSLYENHHYYYAAVYYEKALKKSLHPEVIMLRIAKSYLKVNGIQASSEWFQKAKESHADFSNEDIYMYAQVLAMQERRKESEVVLQELLQRDPNAWQERKFLEDLFNYKMYYKDSAAYDVSALPTNTEVSEFAPAYYKDGIVFSSATPERFSKKKYHWDNSYYLNLVYSKMIDGKLQKSVLFEDDINTKYHDGPAVFYNNFNSMIVNRNQQGVEDKETGNSIWRVGLFDAQYNKEKSSWQLTPISFADPKYSFAHPSINEDGSILYFISDKPGGYGGTDIYRSTRTNGVWSEPFNLGPVINTPENEVFPFFIDNVLYFSSNGHGGLGGLDIYKSEHTVNGFTPPVNPGFPLNSPKDDFSFITAKDQRSGYFSSVRTGNDDLFSFKKIAGNLTFLAHAYDGKTKLPLDGAAVQIMTATAADAELSTDADGNFEFQLPEDTDYIIIASKDGKVGMLTGFAVVEEDQVHLTHQIPVFGDTLRVPCVGTIEDTDGIARRASSIVVIDETTGQEVTQYRDNSLISFLGEKSHQYSVEVRNEQGDTTVHKISVGADDKGSKTWSMVLKNSSAPIVIAARIFYAEDQQPLSNADVKIITFSDPDLELHANENGVVEFTLAPGTAFVLIGSKDNHTGMLSGTAEKGQDKNSIVHPVAAHGDPAPPEPKLIIALVTDSEGHVVRDADARVTDKTSGESVDVKIEDGVLHFRGERGKSYNLSVQSKDYKPTLEEFVLTEEGSEVEKISVVLEKNSQAMMTIAVKVFKAENKSPLAQAQVRVISFVEADQELIADSTGQVEFILPEGTTYMVVGSKDGYVGMHTGTAEQGMDKRSVIHPIPAVNESAKALPVVARITNEKGDLLTNASVIVSDKSTKKKVDSKVIDGILSFMGEKGKEYTFTVDNGDEGVTSHDVKLSTAIHDVQKISVPVPVVGTEIIKYEIAVRAIKASDKSSLGEAQIKVISFIEPDQEIVANGEGSASFVLPEGTDFMIVASKDGYVGMFSGSAVKGMEKANTTHVIETFSENNQHVPVVARIADDKGNTIEAANVKVTEKKSNENIPFKMADGLLSFMGEKGKDYTLTVSGKDQPSITHTIAIEKETKDIQKVSVVVPDQPNETKSVLIYEMAVRVFKESDQSPLGNADVKIISFIEDDRDIVAGADGVADFVLPEGTAYMVIGSKDGFVGMHSGTVEKGTDKISIIHPIAAKGEQPNAVPVVTLIVDEKKNPVVNAEAKVFNKSTGAQVDSDFENGILSFLGEKSQSYRVELSGDQMQAMTHHIAIDSSADVHADVVKIKDKTPSLPPSASVIVFQGDDGAAKIYIQTNDAFGEIVEKDGALYLENKSQLKYLGKGDLKTLASGPGSVVARLGIAESQVISLKNIYFDFNTTLLDENDKSELDKVKSVLQHYPALKLVIRAHADDRGRDAYNLNLSRKRARAVETYLVKKGVSISRIIQEPKGESAPAVICATGECTEQEHQKNRRAEFALSSSSKKIVTVTQQKASPGLKALNSDVPEVKSPPMESLTTYGDILRQHGDRRFDGVVFKVTLGAYRFNTSLTFDELKDLGNVEVASVNGLTYYHLVSYETLKESEVIREKVITRGVKDAYISIYREGKAISLKKLIAQ